MTDLQRIQHIENILGEKLELAELKRLSIAEFYRPAKAYSIDKAKNVTGLVLNSCKFLSFKIGFFGSFTHLQTLRLIQSNITDYSFLKDLTSLEYLDLSLTELSDYSFLTKSKGLTSLDLRGNNLSDVSFLSELKGLTSLVLTGNNLSDVSFLSELKGLTSLDLSDNNLSDVSFLTELKGLTSLDLRGNKLSDVSFLKDLTDLTYLDLNDNPDLPFSDEVLDHPFDAQKILNYIREYYAEQAKGNLRKLNEAKLVVIGEANVGKTCVINRLLDKKFVQTDSTHGIQIRKWKEVELENGEKVQMNVWDFGGQEIMHSTHQFFFTRRTVYVLVVNARENEDTNKTEEWLQRIQNLSQNSPVIIVGNKIDENNRGTDHTSLGYFDIERKRLNEKFPTLLKGIYGITSDVEKPQYDFLFDKFETAIKKEIQNLANIHDEFPKKWFEVKDKLELMKENKTSYIEYGEYIDYCIEAGMDNNQNRKTWIEFLNDIGVALTYSGDKDLGNYLAVLNPQWITSGVYSLIDNAQITLNKGILKREEIGLYLDQTKYPTNTQDFILNMMRKFKLLIDIDKDKTFLIPDLLPKDEPDTGVWKDVLHFQYSYDIYEKSIIRRFMVEMFGLCSKNTYWRNGIVLIRGNNRALIRADVQEKTISVKIEGNQNTRREFLAVIRNNFNVIHNSFNNLGFQRNIGYLKNPEILKPYEELLNMEADGEQEVYVNELRKKVPLSEFLAGIENVERLENVKNVEVFRDINDNSAQTMTSLAESRKNEIVQLKREIADLEKINNDDEAKLFNAENEATSISRHKSFLRYLLITLIAIIWVGVVFYYGWNIVEIWTYVIAIIIGWFLLGLSCWFLRDVTGLNPTLIYEKELGRLCKSFKFDETEHYRNKKRLSDLKYELNKKENS
jgi:internalin A